MKHMLVMAISFLCSVSVAWESGWKMGEYIVPVPSHLAAYASFPVFYKADRTAAGKITLEYRLPEEIVPLSSPKITITGSESQGGLVQFEGDFAEGSCRNKSGSVTCFVLYPGLPLDSNEVNTFLENKYKDATELAARKMVAAIFSADPKGIVNYDRAWDR